MAKTLRAARRILVLLTLLEILLCLVFPLSVLARLMQVPRRKANKRSDVFNVEAAEQASKNLQED